MSSDYEKALADRYAKALQRLGDVRRKAYEPRSAEEMYEGIGRSLKQSLDPYGRGDALEESSLLESIRPTTEARSANTVRKPEQGAGWGEGRTRELIKSEKLGDGRKLDVFYDAENNSMSIEANKIDPVASNKRRWSDTWRGQDIPPKIEYKTIASLKVNPETGHVNFVKSSLEGAKEGAMDRVLMEAQKMGIEPSSSSLTSAGRKMVSKKALDFQKIPKSEYMDRISRFLKTGKAGKIWKAVPFAGPALMAASGDAEGATLELAMDAIDPTGVASPEKMGDAELPSEESYKQQEYNRRIRKMMGKRY